MRRKYEVFEKGVKQPPNPPPPPQGRRQIPSAPATGGPMSKITVDIADEEFERLQEMIKRIPDFGSKRWLIQDQIARLVFDAWLDTRKRTC